MSDFYYVNKIAQSTGEHEVHASSCRYLPSVENRIFLGYFANGKEAVREAKKHDEMNKEWHTTPKCTVAETVGHRIVSTSKFRIWQKL